MFSLHAFLLAVLVAVPNPCSHAVTVDFEAAGARSNDASSEATWHNGGLLNVTLRALAPGDVLVVPAGKTFHLMGGIQAVGLANVVIQIDGVLVFSDDMKAWPTSDGKHVLECLHLVSPINVTLTSKAGKGLLDGQGKTWWGIPGIGYLVRGENRPRLLNIEKGKNVVVENLLLKNSPYWTFWAHEVDGLEVRWTDIDCRRDTQDGHGLIDLTAFNTDGFDVTGTNVWIHDCNVWNQDDSVCVKDNSENMLFERINASGVGLTIGSIGGSTVRNITFRDCHMHNTFKGIYMKFRDSGGLIEDVIYENIVIDNPEQWAIWIGPAQQSDSSNLCAAHPCSICWPTIPFTKCEAPVSGTYSNITLRHVTINNPKQSPGVILATAANPMKGVVFDGVVVNNPSKSGEQYYRCEGVQGGIANGGTSPVPSCFGVGSALGNQEVIV